MRYFTSEVWGWLKCKRKGEDAFIQKSTWAANDDFEALRLAKEHYDRVLPNKWRMVSWEEITPK